MSKVSTFVVRRLGLHSDRVTFSMTTTLSLAPAGSGNQAVTFAQAEHQAEA